MGMYTVKTKHFSSLTPLNFLHSSYPHLQKPLTLSCYCFWIKQKKQTLSFITMFLFVCATFQVISIRRVFIFPHFHTRVNLPVFLGVAVYIT